MEAFVTEAKASGTVCLECFKVTFTIFLCKPFRLAPVALHGIELAMQLGIKQKTVAQCFNLFLQAALATRLASLIITRISFMVLNQSLTITHISALGDE